MTSLFPGSRDVPGFWRDVVGGVDRISDVPAHYFLREDYYDPDPAVPDKVYSTRGSFLDPIDFDPVAFGLPPKQLSSTDSCQLLALVAAKRLLDQADAGWMGTVDRERTSVTLGVAVGLGLLGEMAARLQRPVWLKGLRDCGVPEDEAQSICDRIGEHYVPWTEATFPGVLSNVVAGRIANRFDLGGSNFTTDAACASSFSALEVAANQLALGRCDMAITGGADTTQNPFLYMCFAKTTALSETGDCRPFADGADGTLLGEGVGMVALRRLDDAERDGARILAVIRGVGTGSDGRAKSVYAPLPAGQARTIRRAYDRAGYGPDSVELVEAHGTATRAGDAAEFSALRQVFAESGRDGGAWCALGSVKSQIGHTKSAAAAAGLIKTVLALHHKVLPPTIKVDRPSQALDLDGAPLYLNTRSRPWVRGSDHPRRASVSSFGFGGTNFHVALEEYTGPRERSPRIDQRGTELVTLSAASREALVASARALAGTALPLDCLAHVSRDSHRSFDPAAPARLAVIASDEADLAKRLTALAAALEGSSDAVVTLPGGSTAAVAAPMSGVALLFPGQGSQYLSMGDSLAIHFDEALAVWDRDADSPRPVHPVVFPRPALDPSDTAAQEAALTATEWAQPAIGVASLATLAVLRRLGLKPDMVGGHSFGEVTAAAAAGVCDEAAFGVLARARGDAMARAAATSEGAMLAARCSEDRLPPLPDGVVIANLNHPRQTVLSGTVAGIEAMEAALEDAAIAAQRLSVSTAFHSPVVSAASEVFAQALAEVELQEPGCPVYCNATAAPYADSAGLRDGLAAAIGLPVRFAQQVARMHDDGARVFVEVGPGAVLTGLVERCLKGRDFVAVATDRAGSDGVATLLAAVGRLAAAGVALDLRGLWLDRELGQDPRTVPAPRMRVALDGANVGKLYPPAGGVAALPAPNPPRPVPAPVVVHSVAPPAAASARPAPSPHQPVDAPDLAAWVQGFTELQRITAETHEAAQTRLAASHQRYLDAAETATMTLASVLSGEPMPAPTHAPAPAVQASRIGMPSAPMPAAPMLSLPRVAAPAYAAPTPAIPVSPPAVVAAPAAVGRSPRDVLLAVVADKTGYPEDVLGMDMQLESDLGIDSIKRVEILSAVRDEFPGLGEVDAAEMAALRTLGSVLEYVQAHGAVADAPAAAVSGAPVVATGLDPQAVLLEVVAEKTGYPQDVLGMDMQLESDLGIDSIKRVEILSAVRDRFPALGEVDAAEMAALRTLGQVLDHMRDHGAVAPTGPATPAVAPTAGAAVPAVDAKAVLLAVVAEKTGYPEDVLGMEMHLESDLGIDSIKRVEILSAVREQVPGLGEVDAAQMAALQTLGQVLEAMTGADAAAVEAPSPPVVPVSSTALGRFGPELESRGAGGFAPRALGTAGTIAVVPASEVAVALARALTGHGLPAVSADVAPPGCRAAVFVGGLDAPATADAARSMHFAAFEVAHVLAGGSPVMFVTVQDTGGAFGLGGCSSPWATGLPGLVKTARQEWPGASVRAIDIEGGDRDPDALAEVIAGEILRGDGDIEVGLAADGARRVVRTAERPLSDATVALDVPPDAVIVVSGGARGVTAASALELAKRIGGRWVLLGRSATVDEADDTARADDEAALKRALVARARARGEALAMAEIGAEARRILASREVRATLDAFTDLGCGARYVSVDVRHQAAVEAALAEVRAEWGPVRGVIHGAGVLADKAIADKTVDQVERVWSTKVDGFASLIGATAEDPLAFLVAYSSVAARTGNPGQCDYAMANEVLNRVCAAEAARRPGCVVRALGWGPWAGGMVGPELAELFRQRGVALIDVGAGSRALVAELEHPSGPAEVVIGAGALVPPSDDVDGEYEVCVDAASHPFLDGHRIRSAPVVPLVLVLDWCLRGARRLRPDLFVLGCKDVRVLRGISLDDFGERPRFVTVRCHQVSNGDGAEVAVEIRTTDGPPNYTATVSLAAAPPKSPVAAGPRPDAPWRWSVDEAYERHLFHGAAFRAIRTLDGVSSEGAAAGVVGHVALHWPDMDYAVDVPALDAGLQLGCLYGRHQTGGNWLPTGLSTFEAFAGSPSRCSLKPGRLRSDKMVFDLEFVGTDGNVVARMRGVEMHARPETDVDVV